MKPPELTARTEKFAKGMKNSWQLFFLISVLCYGLSLLHLFYTKPSLNSAMAPHLNQIDLTSYIIAIGLAVAIFSMKRKYFSSKFSRAIVEKALREDPGQSDESLLKEVLAILRRKMITIWTLGLLLVSDGVGFYWLTFSSSNMHIYLVIGAYSLLINYPRNDLFMDLPWFVAEGKKEFLKGEQSYEA